jgi:hypothetical protein
LQDSLVALESFVTDEAWVKHKLMMPIAKTLYDEDIVEEQVWFRVWGLGFRPTRRISSRNSSPKIFPVLKVDLRDAEAMQAPCLV